MILCSAQPKLYVRCSYPMVSHVICEQKAPSRQQNLAVTWRGPGVRIIAVDRFCRQDDVFCLLTKQAYAIVERVTENGGSTPFCKL